MISLSILYIAINVILIIYLVFINPFEARKKTTALLPVLVIFYLLYFFDSYINKNNIQRWALELIMNIDAFKIPTISSLNSSHFLLGIIIIIEILAISFMLYAFYENVFIYTPPLLLNKKERNARIGLALLWKSSLFITLNLFLIFVLKELNYVMCLPLGFLEPLFKLGVSL